MLFGKTITAELTLKHYFIHIGYSKTGTSNIQALLARNRKNLLAMDYIYPGIDIVHHTVTDADMKNWVQEAKNAPYQNIIFSSEKFPYGTELYQLALDNDDMLSVIVYIRLLPSYCESWLSQWMKFRIDHNIFRYDAISLRRVNSMLYRLPVFVAKDYYFSYLNSNLLKFIDDFGKDSFHFVSYEKAKKEGLVKHFCSLIDIDMKRLDMPLQDANISPSTAILYFLLHCGILPLPIGQYMLIADYLINPPDTLKQFFTKHKKKYLLIPKAKHFARLEAQKEELETIAELLGDPTWPQQCYDWLEDKEDCPYNNLPIDIQHEVFDILPPEMQEYIFKAWPKARTAKKDEPLFPNFPTDEDTQSLIEGFVFLEARHTKTIGKLSQLLNTPNQQHINSFGPLHPSLWVRLLTGKPPLRVREAIQHCDQPGSYTTEQTQAAINAMLGDSKSLAYLARRAWWKKMYHKLPWAKLKARLKKWCSQGETATDR